MALLGEDRNEEFLFKSLVSIVLAAAADLTGCRYSSNSHQQAGSTLLKSVNCVILKIMLN